MRLRAAGEPWPAGAACLAWRGHDLPPGTQAEVLSPAGDLAEAAIHLFAALRRLDGQQPPLIVAELVPNEGLGLGINDRLRRAAGLG
jgi:L-threonylcarbamoyladenylate synthase